MHWEGLSAQEKVKPTVGPVKREILIYLMLVTQICVMRTKCQARCFDIIVRVRISVSYWHIKF